MIRTATLFILSSLILCACSFNKIFLHPFELKTTDDFSTYEESVGDTITMTFTSDRDPIILDAQNEVPKLPYQIENIFFPNTQGDTLNAWLFRPTGAYNGHTIYFLHGNAGHLVYQYTFVTPFVKAGYQVFIQDYSGFGFSGGKSTRKNVYQDGQDGFDYLLGRDDVRYEKLLIYGQSLGGHLACVIAKDNQEKIDGLVIEGAFSSHKDIAANAVPILARIFVRELYSAEKSLPDLHKPLLIIHSTEDTRIPYSHGERLYDVSNEPKELYTIKEKHIRGPIYFADSIVEKMKRLVE